jgi:hypothetical protein
MQSQMAEAMAKKRAQLEAKERALEAAEASADAGAGPTDTATAPTGTATAPTEEASNEAPPERAPTGDSLMAQIEAAAQRRKARAATESLTGDGGPKPKSTTPKAKPAVPKPKAGSGLFGNPTQEPPNSPRPAVAADPTPQTAADPTPTESTPPVEAKSPPPAPVVASEKKAPAPPSTPKAPAVAQQAGMAATDMTPAEAMKLRRKFLKEDSDSEQSDVSNF